MSTSSSARRRRSVWVLPLAAGGCGACTQSIYALQATGYAAALKADGISFATSPRHADIILLNGPLTEQAHEAIQQVLDAVPLPRALVAVGNCAIDGCVFAGGAGIIANAAETLNVNIDIPGCPPAPDAILAAIGEAANLLSGVHDSISDTGDTDDADDADDAGEEEA